MTSSSNFAASALMLAAASMVGGALWLAQTNKVVERDPKTLCAPSLENGHTIILVDKTDPWNAAQADRLENHILWLVNKMRPEERLSIYTFSDQLQTGFPPIFSFCKPPAGEAADDIIKSKEYYNRQYKIQFSDPLLRVLENVKKAEVKDCSPIIEVLFDVMLRREISEHPGPNRIVLVSDLAQNSPLYSFFLTTTCMQRAVKGDQRGDTSAAVSFIKQRADAIKEKDMSAIVFQVVPDRNPPDLARKTKEVWSSFFAYFGKTVEWQFL